MIVCHCQGVSDRKIRRTIAHGARDLEAIGRACKAGTSCGACVPVIQAILGDDRQPVEAA